MKKIAFISALLLVSAPAAVLAQCAGGHANEQAMSCIAGTEWDAATQTCLPTATG